MANKISLADYARAHGKDPALARQAANRGSFKTAEKLGRDWVINPAEPWPDRRLKAKDVFTNEAYACLTAEERRVQLKREQVAEYSGWRRYPDTCHAILANIPEDWWDRYTAKQLGEIAALLKVVYDKGVDYGREHGE